MFKPSIDSWILKQLWKPAFIILIPQLFMQVYTTLDKTVVGYFVNPTELSYYDQVPKKLHVSFLQFYLQ